MYHIGLSDLTRKILNFSIVDLRVSRHWRCKGLKTINYWKQFAMYHIGLSELKRKILHVSIVDLRVSLRGWQTEKMRTARALITWNLSENYQISANSLISRNSYQRTLRWFFYLLTFPTAISPPPNLISSLAASMASVFHRPLHSPPHNASFVEHSNLRYLSYEKYDLWSM